MYLNLYSARINQPTTENCSYFSALGLLLTILILFSSFAALYGQTLSAKVELTKDSDTVWAENHLAAVKKLNLINPASDTNFLRISSSKYFLELSKISNHIIFYVKEIWAGKQTKDFFLKSFELEHEQVAAIRQEIHALGIDTLPSGKYIKGWTYGFDGITYYLEQKKENQYTFKSYWTPSIQENLKEARVLSDFLDSKLDKIIEYEKKKKLFEQEVPFYGWTYPGSAIVVKIISNDKAFRKYKRKKKKQLKDSTVGSGC